MLAAGIRTPKELGIRAEVTEQTVRVWMKQTQFKGSALHLTNLAAILNVRTHWLMTGIGPPHRFHSEEYSERELLRIYRQLPTRKQRMVMDLITVIGAYVKD